MYAKKFIFGGFSLTLLSVFLLFPHKPLNAQTKMHIAFTAGYAVLNMEEVNNDLRDSYLFLFSNYDHVWPPDYIKGGVLFEGDFMFPYKNLTFGASISYISGTGSILNISQEELFEERYDVSTFELLTTIGKDIPLNQTLSFFIRGSAGYGRASVHHLGKITPYTVSGPDIKVTNDVSGGYLALRIQTGLSVNLNPVILSVSAAYRQANAGRLKGDLYVNRTGYGNQGIKNIYGNDIKFDYSGLVFKGGLGFQF